MASVEKIIEKTGVTQVHGTFKKYGFDISQPAQTAKEAVQWLYFGYLGAIKDQNGAAMSIGRTSTFLDIYIERDLELICNEIKISKIFKNTRIQCPIQW